MPTCVETCAVPADLRTRVDGRRQSLPPPVVPAIELAVPRLERPEDLVEQVRDPLEQAGEASGAARVVKETRDRAEEIAEEVPRALLRGDLQVHLVEVDDEPEQVEVQRPECQVEDRTGTGCCRCGGRGGCATGERGAVRG